MLTERRAQLLNLIIAEYVDSATPVGSKAIVRKFDVGVSPATIRSEMARLEEDGYITHPHTSAGRVPSDKGYRYYVEALMREQALTDDEKRRIRHQFYQMRRAFEDWLDLAAAILAQAADNAAVVTAPWSPSQFPLQQIQLVGIQESVALLVAVLREGVILQQVINLPTPASQDELTTIATRLNKVVGGLTVEELQRLDIELTAFERLLVGVTIGLMEERSRTSDEEAHLEGLHNLLAQPEFAQSRKILEIIDILNERTVAHRIPFLGLPEDGITVVIGAENAEEAMSDCSVIVSRYGSRHGLGGAVAIVGPTRMQYSRAVPAVRFMASVMSDLMNAYYGQPDGVDG